MHLRFLHRYRSISLLHSSAGIVLFPKKRESKYRSTELIDVKLMSLNNNKIKNHLTWYYRIALHHCYQDNPIHHRKSIRFLHSDHRCIENRHISTTTINDIQIKINSFVPTYVCSGKNIHIRIYTASFNYMSMFRIFFHATILLMKKYLFKPLFHFKCS